MWPGFATSFDVRGGIVAKVLLLEGPLAAKLVLFRRPREHILLLTLLNVLGGDRASAQTTVIWEYSLGSLPRLEVVGRWIFQLDIA